MEIDLAKIFAYSMDCLQSRAQMRSIMMDMYPQQKRDMNVLLAVYESGITREIIQNKKKITLEQFQQYIYRLMTDYGIQKEYVVDGILAWIRLCYGKELADSLFRLQNQNAGFPEKKYHSIYHEEISDAEINRVSAVRSDYEIKEKNDGTIEITKFIGFGEKKIIVPNFIDGKKVTGIAKNAYRSCYEMEELVVSDGIIYIEDGAFLDCINLKRVYLSRHLKALGSTNFRTKDNSPHTHEYYSYVSGLSNYNPIGVFSNTKIESIDLPVNLRTIGEDAFFGCEYLKEIDIPNAVTWIPDRCFCDCISLETIMLSDNLDGIGRYAFAKCSKLNNVKFPKKVTVIDSAAFSLCTSLNNIRLNEGLQKIREKAFQDCKQLTQIIIPASVERIDGDVFMINDWYQPYNDWRYNGHVTHNKNENLTIYCYAGTKGLEFARSEGYPVMNAANIRT